MAGITVYVQSDMQHEMDVTIGYARLLNTYSKICNTKWMLLYILQSQTYKVSLFSTTSIYIYRQSSPSPQCHVHVNSFKKSQHNKQYSLCVQTCLTGIVTFWSVQPIHLSPLFLDPSHFPGTLNHIYIRVSLEVL